MIKQLLSEKRKLFIDGAMGTMLQQLGMPVGVDPAVFCMERPDIVRKVHEDYVKAGADIILTATFGGSSYKLSKGLDPVEFNKIMAENACSIAKKYSSSAIASGNSLGRPIFVAGDIGPIGQFIKPLGDIEPTDFIQAIREQVRGLVLGGVDLLFIETQFDIAEARAAVAAVRMECDLPVFVSMTFEDGVSLTGSTPEIFAATMENMSVDAIGVNCGAGPEQMLPIVRRLLDSCSLPVFAEPNAGLPELIGKETVFRLPAEPFAEAAVLLAKEGVQILGGCCGSTPLHIEKLRHTVLNSDFDIVPRKKRSGVNLTSRSSLVCMSKDMPFVLIGERINPTGKKLLSAEFQAGRFDMAMKYAAEQVAIGTRVLDVNVGAASVKEEILLPELIKNIVARYSIPLCLDSSNIDAIIAALPWHPGSALVNSISGEAGRMELLAPQCRLWGAPFVLLPLAGTDLPKTASDRIKIIEDLLVQAQGYGLNKNMVVVDVLALTAASDSIAPKACLETVAWCDANNLSTTIGLSNISFGLPARDIINSTFLSMAMGCGLSSCIGNPSNVRLRESMDAASLLLGKDINAEYFTQNYVNWKAGSSDIQHGQENKKIVQSLEDAIIYGDEDVIISMVEEELQKGTDPFKLVQERLIPAIQEVGVRYERKEYFLPQLLRSAQTMQKAFKHIKPLLEVNKDKDSSKVIILATVRGDIHDIGKNIVGLMLGNYGFEVHDLGKDVSCERIIEEAKKHHADIICLSALMTTTMPRMEEVVQEVSAQGLTCQVMVGGAVVTSEYAHSIGANYSSDAIEAVRVAQKLLEKNV